MRFLAVLGALPLLGAAAKATTPDSTSKAGRESGSSTVRQVAIIGAGAAGSSTAFHLRRYAEQDGVPVNITIFEKTGRIGGRTLTVNTFDDPSQPVELGASIFIELNHIMWNATKRYNLSIQAPDVGESGVLGVWDGDKFVYTQDYQSWSWWNLAKLFWKYGMAPYRTQKLMQATIAKFLSLYETPYFPFRSLTTRAYELELTYVTGQTGSQFLAVNQISELFAHDIIQASTRVNYASNLAYIHGLDTMVAMAPEGASQVTGGNWQIFHNMATDCGAHIRLNTSVTSIDMKSSDAKLSSSKFILTTKSTEAATSGNDAVESAEFDHVVLAAPYQFSDIKTGDNVLQHAIDEIPYVQLHVTLLTSPFKLSAGFFNLTPSTSVPSTVLTTLADDDEPSSGPQGSGKAGFFSISTLKRVVNPKTGLQEYLYKIFSPEEVTYEFLSRMFGVEIPETITGTAPGVDAATVEPISWYYPHVFYSYPKAYPRVTFQDPVLRDGLYYTSGIESFISTMETSSLMGMNVARLMVDDFLSLDTGGEVAKKMAAGGGSPIDEL